MFAIGLTGGIGSGKSTVADLFATCGVPVVDMDAISHRITSPGGIAMPWIATEFGPSFVTSDGSLDRTHMRALAFSNESARQRLEAIIHPLIRAEADRAPKQMYGPYVIVMAPLLLESGNWKTRVDRILAVDCLVETQIERVIRRNGLTREEVLTIIARQASRETRFAAADDVIFNDSISVHALATRVDGLHLQYLTLAKNSVQY